MDNQQKHPQNADQEDLQGAQPIEEDESSESTDSPTKKRFSDSLLRNPLLPHISMYVVTFMVVILAVWGIGSMIVNTTMASHEPPPVPTPTAISLPSGVPTPVFSSDGHTGGVMRQSQIHITPATQIETRYEVTKYVVEPGDTIFGIAEKFGLKPETVLWSNRYIIGDTPDGLSIGVELNILPVDGVYHKWSEGEGLNGVSSFYGVTPDTIINYPGNNLDPDAVGDFANPRIEPGTMLVVPGGQRPAVAWIVPRDAPASGSSHLGPGACGGILYGDVGTGSFTWPTNNTWLSGYDYTPPVHNGLDFGGDFGHPIYAADTGVVVYSGWSDRGYGNLIVVDHDRGWQTFYAHLMDGTMVPCGSNVRKGQVIAAMGSTGMSTGPHLHFEIRLNGFPVNPWQFLN